MTAPYTVRHYLTADLTTSHRVRHLQDLAGQFTGRPLETVVMEVRAVLGGSPIDMETYRRLHILISHVYHSHGADVALTRRLRDEVNQSLGRRTCL